MILINENFWHPFDLKMKVRMKVISVNCAKLVGFDLVMKMCVYVSFMLFVCLFGNGCKSR